MAGSERRVLIVDDDPDIVDYLSFFLEDEGFAVKTAGRCSTARGMLDEFQPEVILIDALLPGKSGLDLLVSLRRDPKWSEVPMVVVTGNDTLLEDDCQSYLGAHEGVRGPDGVLGKPVDRETLLAVLDTLLDGTGSG
ncbi:MAG: response regulator [Acidobacteria bacterium]|jgi:DNA-binding response OmpR family regulator|nr:response regulator [Acidobacteriota bacterium]